VAGFELLADSGPPDSVVTEVAALGCPQLEGRARALRNDPDGSGCLDTGRFWTMRSAQRPAPKVFPIKAADNPGTSRLACKDVWRLGEVLFLLPRRQLEVHVFLVVVISFR